MTSARKWTLAALVPVAAAALLAALAGSFTPDARASVPSGTPVFSNPTVFDNPFSPFRPGAFRVFTGKSDGARIVVIDAFLDDTRDFDWGGGTVTCRVLQETEFEDGGLVEISLNYFARADDGSVYYFGETVDNYEDGVVVDNDGSWLVGGPGGGDPVSTAAVDDPALFMPANPEEDDEFMPENVPDGPRELDRVVREDVKVKVPAGKYEGCIEVLETDVADGATEKKWYAPGVGVVRGKARGENFALVATTFSALEE